jgi:dihydrofolate synthase / folylpolyglutamate synthase
VTTSLQRRLETLYGLERRKDKLGLDGTRALLQALGTPHERFRSVHVAGTNGKGTVCALIERVLREAGYRTGLYTSPHLVDFRERIRVNGRWVDEDWLERALDRIEALPEGKDRTFFEVATALGFLYFAEQEVDIAVVEVGLGGRLDSTNVIAPEVSVITSIGLDHTEILGDTLEAIAREKAGIVKPGVPVVVGDVPGAASNVVRTIAAEGGAPYVPWDSIVTPRRLLAPFSEPTYGLRAENTGTAIRVLATLADRGIDISEAAVRDGLRLARWPGRLERCPTRPRLWWDGAHNVDGFRWLGRLWEWAHGRPPSRVVLALSRDKDGPSIVGELRRAFPPLHLVVTRSRSERAADPEALRAEAARQGIAVEAAPDVPSAVERALSAKEGDVLLTGSLFAVGEAMEAFGGAPGEQL